MNKKELERIRMKIFKQTVGFDEIKGFFLKRRPLGKPVDGIVHKVSSPGIRFLNELFGICVVIFALFAFETNAFSKTWKIMPLGNSITDGIGSSAGTGGYRDDLYQLLNANGVSFDFVGSLNDGISPDPDHEGHDGYTSEQIDSLILGKLASYSPDIILLHIGTNNIGVGEDDSIAVLSIENIIDKIHNFDNQIDILLSSLIPQANPAKDSIVDNINRRIRDLFYQKSASGYRIYYVGNNEIFKTNANWVSDLFSPDGFHPNDTGYHIMAKVFLNAILNVINGPNAFVTDNFNRNNIGITWVTSGDFALDGGTLTNVSSGSDWSNPAVFVAVWNTNDVSIKWAQNADSIGIESAGLALMLDAPSAQANGYLLLKRQSGDLSLWTVANGVLSDQLGNFPGHISHIKGGDVFEVKMYSDQEGHHFVCYVNSNYDGTVVDPNRMQGNSSVQYVGIMARGQNNNSIDEFNVQFSDDLFPPDPVVDLDFVQVNSSSVTLTWTATGDDGKIGTASKYDIRYSTVPINETNFATALAASNPPTPGNPGETETYTIENLNPNTSYYFAIKVEDDGQNISAISNIIHIPSSSNFLQWEPFEMWFTRHNLPANPYLAEPIFAHFVAPNGQDYRIEGFWDGDSTWGIRFSLTQLGNWNYYVFEKDSSLIAQGTLECTASNLHGFLRINPQNPHQFMYSDGTPFFLMGDTNWDGMTAGVDFETRFKPYIDQRSSQGFNNLNLIVADDRYDYSANEGGDVFYMPTPNSRDYDRLNPAYFDWIDKRVSYSNEHGIIPSLFFSWSEELAKFSDDQIHRYIRYLVARYAAYKVIWILTGEMEEANSLQDYIEWGNLVRNKDPFDNPISLHTVDSCNELADQPWLTFIMQQYRGSYREMYDYISDDWNYDKPVVNGEYGYLVEQYVHQPDGLQHDVNYIRKGAWSIIMAGGGFVTGFGGTFFDPDLHYPEDPTDPTESRYPIPWSLDRAQDLLGGNQLHFLSNFFTQKVNYQDLSPHPEFTSAASAFILADPNKTYVLYSVDSADVNLNLNQTNNWYDVEWWNPDSGVTVSVSKIQGGLNTYFEDNRIGHDFVILLKKSDPDPGYSNPVPLSEITISDLPENSIDISWTTNDSSDSRVESGLLNQFSKMIFDSKPEVNHQIILKDLLPGQQYIFRVSSRDSMGNWAISNDLEYDTNDNYTVRINCGGDEYIASNGIKWLADKAYSNGSWGYVGGHSYSTADSISNTTDDVLYQSERYGMSGYKFDVPNGRYRVRLLFAEVYWGEAGRRIFDVDLEGTRVLDHYDIYSEVGKDAAAEKEYVVEVGDGVLEIGFTNERDNSKISGIEVKREVVVGPANRLVKVSGDGQTGEAYHALGDSLRVRVEDSNGHGISGLSVVFFVGSGGGHVMGDSIRETNAAGECGVRWWLGGSVGEQRLGVYVAGVDSLEFSASAVADTSAAAAGSIEVDQSAGGVVRISWETGEFSVGFVEYGLDTGYGIEVSDSSGMGLAHSVALSGLAEGQVYHYRIHTEDYAGNTWVSADSVFEVMAAYERRVNCGGSAYADGNGVEWSGDQPYSAGSWGYVGGHSYSTADSISNTTDDVLYQSERYGMSGYKFDVPNGVYEVSLYFDEIFFHEAGRRIFDVTLEDKNIIRNLDIYSTVGFANAYALTFNCTISDSLLDLNFSANINFPKISAIYIKRVNSFNKKKYGKSQQYNFVNTPTGFEIQQSYPNPYIIDKSGNRIRIQYQIPAKGDVQIEIYNILGRRIREFELTDKLAGYYEFAWDGRNKLGNYVPSGIYFYRIDFKSKMKVKKFLVLRK